MNKQELLYLIEAKIEGQGNQVDTGSILPAILKGLVNGVADTLLEVDDFEEFDATTPYSQGDVVRYDGKLYEFTTDHTGEWDDDDVEQTNVFSLLVEEIDKIKSKPVTIAELKAMRDNGELTMGSWYKITDYKCGTTQAETKVEEHPFDVIVMATDEKTLAHEGYACVKADDDYYTKYGASLNAWKVWFDIDADGSKYTWCNPSIVVEDVKYDRKKSLDEVSGSGTTYYAWYGEGTKIYTKSETPSEGDATYDENFELGDDIGSVTLYDGNGVIYRMIDEWGNDCPYDFKQIQFKRYAITEYDKVPSLVVDGDDNSYGYYYGAKDLGGESAVISGATLDDDQFGYFFTFALKDIESGDWFDYSVVQGLGLKNDEGVEMSCRQNVMQGGFQDEYKSSRGELSSMLPNNVFFNCYTNIEEPSYADDYSYCYGNTLGVVCYCNTFGNGCNNNTFGNNNYRNTFGNGCYSNTFGNYFQYNTFGNGCGGNTFGNNNYRNTFGNYCNNNTFGNDNYQNTFGNYCNNNTFGNECGGNTFGNECYSNTFGNECGGNTFGNGCGGNTFGNECRNNTFGNYLIYSEFGNGCKNIECGKNSDAYARYIKVGDGCQYLMIIAGTASNNQVQNALILNGLQGTSSSKLTITFAANKSYCQVAGRNTSGTLQVWNPADNA